MFELPNPKEVWDSVEGFVFNNIWPDRPWRSLPGGVEHLQRRSASAASIAVPISAGAPAPAPVSSSGAPAVTQQYGASTFAGGARWEEREGDRWVKTRSADQAVGYGRARNGDGVAAPADFSSSHVRPSEVKHAMKQPMANQHGGAVGGLAACANHAGTGGGLAAVMRPGGGAQFSVTSELEQFFKEPEGLCALKIRIVDRVFTLDDALDGFSSTVAADFHRMRETFLSEDEPCYVLFSARGGLWVLFNFVPESAPFQERMSYSIGEQQLINLLGGTEQIPWQEHWTKLSEVVLPSDDGRDAASDNDGGGSGSSGQNGALERARSHGIGLMGGGGGGGGGGDSAADLERLSPGQRASQLQQEEDEKYERMAANLIALTPVERMMYEGWREAKAAEAAYKQRVAAKKAAAATSAGVAAHNPSSLAAAAAAAAAAGGASAAKKGASSAGANGAPAAKPASAAVPLQFPLSAVATTNIGAFKAGAYGAVILAIEGERLELKATQPPKTPAVTLRGAIGKEPCYVLYRYEHVHDGAPRQAVVFLFMRPEDAPLRGKMLHASSMRPFVASLQASGLEIAKVIEGLELHEVNDKELSAQLYVYE